MTVELVPVRPAPGGPAQPSSALKLLLCCARTYIDRETAGRVRTLSSDTLNWVEFFGLARHHGVLPLVWSSVKHACPGAVPSTLADRLDRYAHSCGARNRHLAEETVRLLALLDAQSIAAVPLKGPVLAAELYGDLSLRECLDIDVLIRQENALRAKEVLLAAGYQLKTELDMDGFPGREYEREYLFTHTERAIQAELRWSMAPEGFLGSLGMQDLGERRKPVRLLDAVVDYLPPEEHLLVLCVHGSKEHWTLLKWICDVAELVRAFPDLDWERLRARARGLGYRRVVALGLALAHDLLEAPVPEAVLSEVGRDTGACRLAAELRAQLVEQHRQGPSTDEVAPWSTDLVMEWARRRYAFRLAERVQDKLWNGVRAARLLPLCLRLLVPTNKDRRVLALPAPLSFFYYALRPARVATDFVRIATRHLGTAVKSFRLVSGRPTASGADQLTGRRRRS